VKQAEIPAEQIRIDSPIGKLIISARDGAVCSIALANTDVESGIKATVSEPVLRQAAQELGEYFSGKRTRFTFAMRAEGTPFQQSVWAALLDIPFGETKSYGEIAKAVENPKGSRAVGMACNKNPIMIAVPCHRVVGANGSLTGYAYGTGIKQSLLDLERQKK